METEVQVLKLTNCHSWRAWHILGRKAGRLPKKGGGQYELRNK